MNTLTLTATHPKHLEAKVKVAEAKKAAKGAVGRRDFMLSRNAEHAQELMVKSKSGRPLATNWDVQKRGGGSGFEVIYHACHCARDNRDECGHDPRESPFTADQIAEAEAAIVTTTKAHAAAEGRLAKAPTSFDVLAEARAAGAAYVWWPLFGSSPSRYRGEPLTTEQVEGLGIHELRRHVQAGSVLEVDV